METGPVPFRANAQITDDLVVLANCHFRDNPGSTVLGAVKVSDLRRKSREIQHPVHSRLRVIVPDQLAKTGGEELVLLSRRPAQQ